MPCRSAARAPLSITAVPAFEVRESVGRLIVRLPVVFGRNQGQATVAAAFHVVETLFPTPFVILAVAVGHFAVGSRNSSRTSTPSGAVLIEVPIADFRAAPRE